MNVEQLQQDVMNLLEQQLPSDLLYHNPQHTHQVLNAVERIGAYEHISAPELELLKAAALLHDIGFIRSYENHEEHSCAIARELLPKYGVSALEIEHIVKLILSTKVPQSPYDKLSQILCDADLDYLGTDQFFNIGDLLFEEFKIRGIVHTREEWNVLQVKFLKHHQYFTHYAEQFRVAQKMQNLKSVEILVERAIG